MFKVQFSFSLFILFAVTLLSVSPLLIASLGIDESGLQMKTEDDVLVYPWVSNNKDSFESIIIVNNLTSIEQEVTLRARRFDGSEEKTTAVIPANGFLKEPASQLFPLLGDGSGYTVKLSAQTNRIRGSWVTNNLTAVSGQSPSQGVAVRVDGSDIARMGKSIVFGYLPVSADFFSAPVIVNTGNQPADVTIHFYDNQGDLVNEFIQENLEPMTPFTLIANDMVTGSNAKAVYAQAFAEQTLTGVTFVFNTLGETAIGNVTSISSKDALDSDKPLVFPWISNSQGAFQSTLYINNIRDSRSFIRLTARRADGTTENVTVQIPARGSLFADASTLFSELGSGSGYSVTAEFFCRGRCSSTGYLTGGWVTNNLQAASTNSPSQGTAIDPNFKDSERYGEDLLFSYLPLQDGFSSAPVLVNLDDRAIDVTLRYFDSRGNEIEIENPTIISLMPFEPFAAVTNALVPEGTDDVMLIVDSPGGKLTGVSFVFNTTFFEPAIGNATKITLAE